MGIGSLPSAARVVWRHAIQVSALQTPLAPAARALGVRHASSAAALVAPGALAPRVLTCRSRAGAAAVALAAIATAAQQHLRAAARAHELAGGMVSQASNSSGQAPRGRLARTSASVAWHWTVTSGNATLAPHPLLRHGVGHGAVRSFPAIRAAAVPTYSGHGGRSTALSGGGATMQARQRRTRTARQRPLTARSRAATRAARIAFAWETALQGGLPGEITRG